MGSDLLRSHIPAASPRMNKLLIFCLLSAALLALTYAEDQSEQQSLAELSHSRMARDAHPKRRARKNKKSKKNSMRGKGMGGTRKNKKGMKTRKNKKGQRKQKGKGQRKIGDARQANGTCLSEACLTNAVSFMKILKDEATNYKKQNARIAASKKQAGGKAGKKGLFKVLINQIREAGGGDARDLQCNGKNDSNGAMKFQNLTKDLKTCEADIDSACNATLPTVNSTMVDECMASIKEFENLTTAAIAATGEAACALWEADVIVAAAAKLKDCSLAGENTNFTKAKKACTKAFGKCRKLEDEVGGALSACSATNSPEALQAAIAAGTKNKAAAGAVTKKVAEVAAARRQAATVKCGEFTVSLTSASEEMAAAPLNPGLAAILEALVALIVAPCTEEEKAGLKAAGDAFEESASAIDEAIAAKMTDLEASTGSTIDPDSATAGTTEECTCPEGTTLAATTGAVTTGAATTGAATTAAATTAAATTGAATTAATTAAATTAAATTT